MGGSSSQSSLRDRERERFEPFFGFGSGPLRPLGLLQPQRRTDLDEDYDEEDDALSEDDEDAFLIDGDQFSLPGAVVSSEESIKASLCL